MASTDDVVSEYLAALGAHDIERILACVADDFVNEHTSALGASSEGRETYRGRLPNFLAQFEALTYTVDDLIVDGERAAARYRLTAGYDGHPIDITGVMLFVVRDSLIARRTDVWDSLTFLRQAGLAGSL